MHVSYRQGRSSVGGMGRTIDLAIIAGDGIGPEVVAEGEKVLRQCLADEGVTLNPHPFDLGADRYLATGEILTDEDLSAIRDNDAILLGAIGDPRVRSGILERGLLLKLRFELDHYINLRPSVYYPGVPTPLADPGEIDFVVVREGTEGLYAGHGGSLRTGTPAEIATEVSVNTAYGVERTVRYAFELAPRRPRRHLTLVHKHNVLVNAGGMWARIVEEVSAEYPEVTWEYCHVDAATIYLVTDPSRFDVIVTDNLFGDILTDEAGAITGGIGLAASGNLNPDRTTPSMFEPVHGSAPDIAGRGVADPTATIASVALMLDFLGLSEQARRVERAIAVDMDARARTDLSGRTTSAIGEAIRTHL